MFQNSAGFTMIKRPVQRCVWILQKNGKTQYTSDTSVIMTGYSHKTVNFDQEGHIAMFSHSLYKNSAFKYHVVSASIKGAPCNNPVI
jgi:hypothetical protein